METTIPSLLTARPSKQPKLLGHQISTHQWWDTRLHRYEIYTSQTVLDEAARGDREMADARLAALDESRARGVRFVNFSTSSGAGVSEDSCIVREDPPAKEAE